MVVILFNPFGLIAPITFIWLSNLPIWDVFDEGFSRNASCALIFLYLRFHWLCYLGYIGILLLKTFKLYGLVNRLTWWKLLNKCVMRTILYIYIHLIEWMCNCCLKYSNLISKDMLYCSKFILSSWIVFLSNPTFPQYVLLYSDDDEIACALPTVGVWKRVKFI